MNRLLSYGVALVLLVCTAESCPNKNNEPTPPVPDFEYQYLGEGKVSFLNKTAEFDRVQWSFGDGSPTSEQNNPTYTYASEGSFSVTLTIWHNGQQYAKTKPVVVKDPAPVAGFTADVQAEGSVVFQNTSASFKKCRWNFGDGSTSEEINPRHVFAKNDRFRVELTVFNALNASGQKSDSVSVRTVTPKSVVVRRISFRSTNALMGVNFYLTGGLVKYGDGKTGPPSKYWLMDRPLNDPLPPGTIHRSENDPRYPAFFPFELLEPAKAYSVVLRLNDGMNKPLPDFPIDLTPGQVLKAAGFPAVLTNESCKDCTLTYWIDLDYRY
jgi:PKD repeat protein